MKIARLLLGLMVLVACSNCSPSSQEESQEAAQQELNAQRAAKAKLDHQAATQKDIAKIQAILSDSMQTETNAENVIAQRWENSCRAGDPVACANYQAMLGNNGQLNNAQVSELCSRGEELGCDIFKLREIRPTLAEQIRVLLELQSISDDLAD